MVTQIVAKTLLSYVPQPDPWFGLRYNMNLYRGCQHGCIYCDSRSECYGIENFTEIQVKSNAVELLDRELGRKRVKGVIGTGSMNDPYMPLEAELGHTREALQVIARRRFPVHILTKSDLVVRDIDILQEVRRAYAAVSFTITTADDGLCRKVEPGAPPASRRFAALAALREAGLLAGVLLMPVLPFLEDSEDDLALLIQRSAEAGAAYILPSFGVTLRDRQRAYFYTQLDRYFPEVRREYERLYGNRYSCRSPRAARLEALIKELCARHGIAARIPPYEGEQLRLF